jgi:hypothetical protein
LENGEQEWASSARIYSAPGSGGLPHSWAKRLRRPAGGGGPAHGKGGPTSPVRHVARIACGHHAVATNVTAQWRVHHQWHSGPITVRVAVENRWRCVEVLGKVMEYAAQRGSGSTGGGGCHRWRRRCGEFQQRMATRCRVGGSAGS